MTQISGLKKLTNAGLQSSPALGAICSALADILSDGMDVHRCLAAKALGRIGSETSVGPLVGALMDEDEDVRTDAAEALRAIGDPAAADQLFKNLLGDPCTEVKLSAIDALAALQDRRVIPWLRRMVLGRDQDITWDEDEFFSSGWDDWVEVQAKAITALADFGESEAVDDIVAALKDESAQDITEMTFKALARMGPKGISALAGFLDESTTRPRRRAARVLATIEKDDIQDHLARVFSDVAPDVRLAALRARAAVFPQDTWIAVMQQDADPKIRAEAIGLATAQYGEDLLGLLADPSPEVQEAALVAFAGAKNTNEVSGLSEKLAEMTGSASSGVARAAAITLARLLPGDAAEILANRLNDIDLGTAQRLAALHGLAQVSDPSSVAALIGRIDDDERQIRLEIMAALATTAKNDPNWPNPAGDALLMALGGHYAPQPDEDDEEIDAFDDTANDETPEVVAVQPEDQPEPAVVSTLESILADAPGIAPVVGLPDSGVELTPEDMERLAIARKVVGKRKIPRAVEIVVSEDVQRFSARVLGDLDKADVVNALAAALSDADQELVLAAAQSIASITARGQKLSADVARVLVAQLEKASRDAKLPLIRALSACSGDDVTFALIAQLSDADSFVRCEAIRALADAGGADVDFEPMLGDADPSVRLCAATAMANLPEPETLTRLIDFTFSFEGHHGRQTARLLHKLNSGQASGAFLAVLKDPDMRRLWPVAIEALEELNQSQEQPLGSLV